MVFSNYSHDEGESAEISLRLRQANAAGALILVGFEINRKVEGIRYNVCLCQMSNKNGLRFWHQVIPCLRMKVS